MKQGKTLLELGQELERQRRVRKDFIADTRSLMMTTDVDRNSRLDNLELATKAVLPTLQGMGKNIDIISCDVTENYN